MFGHRSPMRQINCVGGNGMASLGKAFIPLALIAGLVYLVGKKR